MQGLYWPACKGVRLHASTSGWSGHDSGACRCAGRWAHAGARQALTYSERGAQIGECMQSLVVHSHISRVARRCPCQRASRCSTGRCCCSWCWPQRCRRCRSRTGCQSWMRTHTPYSTSLRRIAEHSASGAGYVRPRGDPAKSNASALAFFHVVRYHLCSIVHHMKQ